MLVAREGEAMTEAEWLACGEAHGMIALLPPAAWNERRGRLFAVACCRLIRALPDDRLHKVIDIAERFADGQASDAELSWAVDAAREAVEWEARHDMSSCESHAAEVVAAAAAYPAEEYTAIDELLAYIATEHGSSAGLRVALECTRTALANLVGELIGNPFRRVTFPPEWRTSTALALATQMYDSRDFGAMPILADALQDAGCASDDILDHCRGEGPHVRGCWVVDLVLGKE
jgi:hypothetical protein